MIPFAADSSRRQTTLVTPIEVDEIHNPELQIILRKRIQAGNFASAEEMLLNTFHTEGQPAEADERRARAAEAAARIRQLSEGVNLKLPEGMSLREYAHI